jgi:4-alpha-glucanotransferase
LSTHDTTNWPAWWENEAGTIDEALFEKRCAERGIDFLSAKQRLFDAGRSRHARLRWLQEIGSPDKLVSMLGRKKEELADFIEMYENTYREKEKLWRHLGLGGAMREECDSEIMGAVLSFTLKSNSVFSIQLISDMLLLGGILSGDPYRYRINTPGTSGPQNWSWVAPVALEDLIRHPLTARLKEAVASSGRI